MWPCIFPWQPITGFLFVHTTPPSIHLLHQLSASAVCCDPNLLPNVSLPSKIISLCSRTKQTPDRERKKTKTKQNREDYEFFGFTTSLGSEYFVAIRHSRTMAISPPSLPSLFLFPTFHLRFFLIFLLLP